MFVRAKIQDDREKSSKSRMNYFPLSLQFILLTKKDHQPGIVYFQNITDK